MTIQSEHYFDQPLPILGGRQGYLSDHLGIALRISWDENYSDLHSTALWKSVVGSERPTTDDRRLVRGGRRSSVNRRLPSHLVEGIAAADSWATDAHKWLNVPYDSGLVFCRRPEHLRAAMSVSAAYLEQSGGRGDPYQYTPEMSRRARAVEVWAALRSLGRTGLADLVERTCRHAARFAEGLRAAGYQVLNEVVSNQVLVSFGDAETTRRVIAAVQADGTCWCGGTLWHGQAAMRISVSSWVTSDADVERSLAAMLRIAAEG